MVITIGREFGSGGKYIGQRLAEDLGMKLYDKEILSKVSEESGIELEVLEEVDENDYPEAIPHGCFKNDISYAEVEVLIAWMKVYWFENMLSNSDNYEDLYTDANIKTFSRANLIDKNTNVLKDARKTAERAESRYSRVNSLRRPSLGDVNND